MRVASAVRLLVKVALSITPSLLVDYIIQYILRNVNKKDSLLQDLFYATKIATRIEAHVEFVTFEVYGEAVIAAQELINGFHRAIACIRPELMKQVFDCLAIEVVHFLIAFSAAGSVFSNDLPMTYPPRPILIRLHMSGGIGRLDALNIGAMI